MVLDSSPALSDAFHALAHPARRGMLRRLAGGAHNLSQLAAPMNMSFPAASKHVRVLERARMVTRRVVGREHICELRAQPLRDVARWTGQFRQKWEARFEALDAVLEEMQRPGEVQSPPAELPPPAGPSRPAPRTSSRGRSARSARPKKGKTS